MRVTRHNTKAITLKISQELWDELILAAADSSELDEADICAPERYALECVESVLASRRLDRLFP